MSAATDLSRHAEKTLKDAGIEFSILGNDEGCTGDPARRAGNEYLFDMLATENAETFKEKGVRKVVTHCPHCLNSLKNEYPEFGVQLEVIHHSELLQKLVLEGKSLKNKMKKSFFTIPVIWVGIMEFMTHLGKQLIKVLLQKSNKTGKPAPVVGPAAPVFCWKKRPEHV